MDLIANLPNCGLRRGFEPKGALGAIALHSALAVGILPKKGLAGGLSCCYSPHPARLAGPLEWPSMPTDRRPLIGSLVTAAERTMPGAIRQTLPVCVIAMAMSLVALPLHAQEAADGPRVAVVPPQVAGKPPLTLAEAAALDRLLAAWEQRSSAVQTWSCRFYKWEYNAWSPAGENGDRLAFSESSGELKYAAPDKGLYRVRESRQWNPESRRYETIPGDSSEHWVCNGTSIYEFRHAERQLKETVLPPEMQGKAISDGPLPFVFGAKAETLKQRYAMRIITPQGVNDQVWL